MIRSRSSSGSPSASPAPTPPSRPPTPADAAYTLAGGTAVYDTSVLQRLLRDAHVPTQHIQAAPKLFETVGRALLGQEIDAATL